MTSDNRPSALVVASEGNPQLPQLAAALANHGLDCLACAQAAQIFASLIRYDPVRGPVVVAIILEDTSGMSVQAMAKTIRGLPGRAGLPLLLVGEHLQAPSGGMILPQTVTTAEIARLAAMPPESWTASSASAVPHQPPSEGQPPGSTDPVFDSQTIAMLDASNPGIGRKLAESLLTNMSSAKEEFPRCLASGNLEQLRRAAHKLKGGSGSLGAMELHQACYTLELAARNKDREASTKAVATALQALARLQPELISFADTLPKG